MKDWFLHRKNNFRKVARRYKTLESVFPNTLRNISMPSFQDVSKTPLAKDPQNSESDGLLDSGLP